MMRINGRRRRGGADERKREIELEKAVERTGIKGLSRLQKRRYGQNRPCRSNKLDYIQFVMWGIAFMRKGATVELGTQ